MASLFGWQMVLVAKNLPANAKDAGDWVQSLGQEDLLEEEMTTHSRILAWATVHGVTKSQTCRLRDPIENLMKATDPFFGKYSCVDKLIYIPKPSMEPNQIKNPQYNRGNHQSYLTTSLPQEPQT